MFDPDYRTKGWNKSKYAPKNFGRGKKGRKHTPITDFSISMGALVGLLLLGFFYYTRIIDITWGLGIAGGVGVTIFLYTGTTLYNREARYIDRQLNPEKYAEKERREAEIKKEKAHQKSEERSRKQNNGILSKNTEPTITINQDAGKPIIGSHSTMSAREFEEQIAWLINATTPYRAEVVGGSRDGGIDIKVFGNKNKLVGIVQCKRYQPDKPLAPTHARSLAGVKKRMNVDVAYLATTAYFTDDTHLEAKELGIRLLDGDKINHMVYKTSKRFR